MSFQERKRTVQEIRSFLDTKIAPKEFVKELKVGVLLPLPRNIIVNLLSIAKWYQLEVPYLLMLRKARS